MKEKKSNLIEWIILQKEVFAFFLEKKYIILNYNVTLQQI